VRWGDGLPSAIGQVRKLKLAHRLRPRFA
jgi:hypothetical protein